ncbi:hypothetical protein D9M71_605910 [compost metagenome]
MVGTAIVLVVVHHPVHEAVDQDVGIAHRDGVAPHRGDLPDIVTRAAAVGLPVVEVDLEIVEAGNRQVEARTDQVGLDVAFTELVGHRQQHVGHRTELDLLVEDLAEGQARLELAVVGVVTDLRVLVAVVEDLVQEEEVIAVLPAIRVLEGHGLLNLRIDLEVLAVEVGQAVVLPEQQITGEGLATSEQSGGKGEAVRQILGIHGLSLVVVGCSFSTPHPPGAHP